MPAARKLIEALSAFYRGPARAGDPEAAETVAVAAIALERCAGEAALATRVLPVAALLAPALSRITSPACLPLRDAIGAAEHAFRWRQNPNYTDANMGAAFMAGYGYVEFAGPKDALFDAAAIRVGLLVLGPGLHYPPHAHPAEEVYHPLTDGAQWRRGGESWRRVAAGAAIHHPPMIEHETRAGPATLLALYCWYGDTTTEARLSP